jgi:hypothetical protein
MPDVRITPPRRAGAVIYLHAADITAVMLQEDVLHSFTEEEITKIAFAVTTELQSRQPQLERKDATEPA